MIGDKLFTPRLKLRKVEEEDLPLLVQWSNSKEAYGDWLTPEQIDFSSLKSQVEAGTFWNEKEKIFIIELRDPELPIGTIHYWYCPGRHCVIMALKIALPDQRHRGYGTEAQKFLIIDLFAKKEIEYIEMYTDVNNLFQQRCLRKLGFSMVRTLEYDDINVTRTGILYRLTATEFQNHPVYQFHYEM